MPSVGHDEGEKGFSLISGVGEYVSGYGAGEVLYVAIITAVGEEFGLDLTIGVAGGA